MKTQLPTQDQYERNEALSLMAQLQRVEKAPLTDRKQGQNEYRAMMVTSPEIIGERIEWILSGNYGYGAMKTAQRSVGSRGNKVAQVAMLFAALEYGCPAPLAAEAFKSLSDEQKKAVTSAIEAAIA